MLDPSQVFLTIRKKASVATLRPASCSFPRPKAKKGWRLLPRPALPAQKRWPCYFYRCSPTATRHPSPFFPFSFFLFFSPPLVSLPREQLRGTVFSI